MAKREPREVLGVRANASMAKCQKAYRKLVMELHPDRNGDPAAAERFKEVQEAWDRLNGKDCEADHAGSAAASNLCQLFINVVGEVLAAGGDPCERDIKATMLAKLRDHKRNVEKSIREVTAQRDKMKRMLGRWKAGDDETPLEQVLRAKLAEGGAIVDRVTAELAMVDASLELLGSWTYKRDDPPLPARCGGSFTFNDLMKIQMMTWGGQTTATGS